LAQAPANGGGGGCALAAPEAPPPAARSDVRSDVRSVTLDRASIGSSIEARSIEPRSSSEVACGASADLAPISVVAPVRVAALDAFATRLGFFPTPESRPAATSDDQDPLAPVADASAVGAAVISARRVSATVDGFESPDSVTSAEEGARRMTSSAAAP
jgi:hypothetical protein